VFLHAKDNPADEDAQLVDKILAMRVVRKKVVNQVFNGFVSHGSSSVVLDFQ
jgi:hypothetical protein